MVKIADIYALKRKLEKEKKEAAYQALVEEKHGEAKDWTSRCKRRRRSGPRAAAKKAAAERQSQLIQATGHLKEIFQLSESPGMSLEGEVGRKDCCQVGLGRQGL